MRRVFLTSVVCVTALAAAPAARAQLSRLDKVTLIEGLRKEGMGELLEHMASTEDLGDPILKQQVLINQHLLDYADKRKKAIAETDGVKAAELRKQAMAAFEDAMNERRGLIKDLYANDQRPLWQTDLVEQQIFEYLQVIRDNATDFYEFGVPSEEQREAFETVVPETIEEMSDANLQLFHEQGELPKLPDHEAKRLNTGLWDRMINQYYKLRVPYYLAHAAYYTALLPDSHPYYKSLNDPKILEQKKTPAEERARLLTLTIEKLGPYSKDVNDEYAVRRPATCMIARALIQRGKPAEAIALLDPLIKDGTADRTNLLAMLAKAEALDFKPGNPAALAVLSDAQSQSLAKENLLFRVLVVDATYRLLMRRAELGPAGKRAMGEAEAYEPYQKLLDDPGLGDKADSLKDFIYRRWEAGVPVGKDVSNLPAMVVAAIGEIARSKGQALTDQAATEQDSAKAGQLRAQGKEKLERAIALNEGLLKRADLTKGVRAQAMFNRAVAIYYEDQRDQQKMIRCAVLLTEMADELPDQKLSEPAIVNAVSLLHFLHQGRPRPADVAGPYERAADVLISKYPETKAALDERYYYANEVLAPAGKLARAVDVLKALPADHPDYFAAQRLMLDCLQQEYRAAKGALAAAAAPAPAPATQAATAAPRAPAGPAVTQAAVDALAAQVDAEATRIRDEATRALPGASTQDAPVVRHAAGYAVLVQADMAMEEHGKADEVVAILKDFDRVYSSDKDLIRLMLEKRIVALFKADKLDDAVNESKRMMDAFPEDAAPVVDHVLTGLDAHMEDLRARADKTLIETEKASLRARADAISKQELELASYLFEWAKKQGLAKDRMVPFELVYAKSLRLSGSPQKAIDVLTPLLPQNPDNADLIFNAAEAYFTLGGAKNLQDNAAPLYDKLINGIAPENGKYPGLWWTAWMRRLQISDITGQGTDQIDMRVRQLRTTDPALGGEATRRELERLGTKWGGRG